MTSLPNKGLEFLFSYYFWSQFLTSPARYCSSVGAKIRNRPKHSWKKQSWCFPCHEGRNCPGCFFRCPVRQQICWLVFRACIFRTLKHRKIRSLIWAASSGNHALIKYPYENLRSWVAGYSLLLLLWCSQVAVYLQTVGKFIDATTSGRTRRAHAFLSVSCSCRAPGGSAHLCEEQSYRKRMVREKLMFIRGVFLRWSRIAVAKYLFRSTCHQAACRSISVRRTATFSTTSPSPTRATWSWFKAPLRHTRYWPTGRACPLRTKSTPVRMSAKPTRTMYVRGGSCVSSYSRWSDYCCGKLVVLTTDFTGIRDHWWELFPVIFEMAIMPLITSSLSPTSPVRPAIALWFFALNTIRLKIVSACFFVTNSC